MNFSLCTVVVLVLSFTTSVLAGERNLSGSVTLTSDYFWRGYSKSDEDPSLQANIEFNSNISGSGFFAGVWAAEVDLTDGNRSDASDYEIVPYLGWSQGLSDDYRIDVQMSRYIYNHRIFGKGADYYELYLFAHYRDLLSAEFAYAPDAYDLGKDTFNYQLTGRYSVLASTEISTGVGFFEASDLFAYDYWYWNLGATWHLEYFAVDVRYIGSKEVDLTMPTRSFWTVQLPYEPSKWVLSISVGF